MRREPLLWRLLLPLAVLASVVGAATPATSTTTDTCYWLDGTVSPNSYRCNNATTGHSTCCQAGATCYSNGVCEVVNVDIQDWQRVGCTDQTWTDPACLDQCIKYANGSSAGIRPCDGILDGLQYCCDPGPRVGSFACCNTTSDIFILGTSLPTILAQMPLSQASATPSSSSSATPSSSASATGTGTAPASTPPSSDSRHATAVGLGVGLGLGLPLLAAVAGAIWFFARRARNRRSTSAGPDSSPLPNGAAAYGPTNASSGGEMSMHSSVLPGSAAPSSTYYSPSQYQSGLGPGGEWNQHQPQPPYEMYPGSPVYPSGGGGYYPQHGDPAQGGGEVATPKYGGPPVHEMSQVNAPVELPTRMPNELPGKFS